MRLYTLGTSNRSLEEFLEILNYYKIEVVFDVRHFPTSKLFPHFKKDNLEKFLRKNKINYIHLEKLGGYRKEGYENYMKTKDFQEGLEDLIRIAKNKNSVIICAERLPWKCHRAYIGRILEKEGCEIIHLIEKDKTWQPKKEPREIKPSCQRLKFLKKLK